MSDGPGPSGSLSHLVGTLGRMAGKTEKCQVGDQPEFTVDAGETGGAAVFYDPNGRGHTSVPGVAAPKLTDKDDEKDQVIYKVPYPLPEAGHYTFTITHDGKTTVHELEVEPVEPAESAAG